MLAVSGGIVSRAGSAVVVDDAIIAGAVPPSTAGAAAGAAADEVFAALLRFVGEEDANKQGWPAVLVSPKHGDDGESHAEEGESGEDDPVAEEVDSGGSGKGLFGEMTRTEGGPPPLPLRALAEVETEDVAECCPIAAAPAAAPALLPPEPKVAVVPLSGLALSSPLELSSASNLRPSPCCS